MACVLHFSCLTCDVTYGPRTDFVPGMRSDVLPSKEVSALQKIWHYHWYILGHSIWHIYSGTLSGMSSSILSGNNSGTCSLSGSVWHTFWHSNGAHCDLAIAAAVRWCPLKCGACCGGFWEFAVEVQ